MIWYNLKIALRNIIRHRNQCLIGLLGLATGFTAYILISLFVQYEYSWDKHNENYNRIYRVQRHFLDVTKSVEGNDVSPHTRAITSKALDGKFPEIESVLLLRENREAGLGFLATNPENQFFEEMGIVAEQSILKIFTYHFIEGDPKNALTEPFTVVLSKSVAKKLFQGKRALGNTVILEKKYNFKVTGVYDDLPLNSIIRPTFILSLSTLEKYENVKNDIWSGNFMTYVLLNKNADYKALNNKLKGLHKNINGIEREEIRLCPLSKLHLDFNGNRSYIYVLWLYKLIGVLILILTAFNYINLFTALSSNRAKEVAVRKVHGSDKFSLMNMFLSEAAIMAFVAIGLAFAFTEILLPIFNSLINIQLALSYSQNFVFIFQLILITLLVGVLSGAYPAFIMASQKITMLFKGSALNKKSEKMGFRKGLISFQFGISMFLVVVAVFVSLQIKYLVNKELGMDKENLLLCRFETKTAKGDFDQLRNRLLTHPEILNASMSKKIPMYQHGGWEVHWEDGRAEEKVHFRFNEASYDFVETMGLKIVDGRDFSREFSADEGHACLINETGAKALGWKNPIGKWIGRKDLRVVGVIKDFHINNVFNKIEPYMVVLRGNELKNDWMYAFRIAPGKVNAAKKVLKEEMELTFPDDAFEFHLFVNDFKQQDVLKTLEAISRTLFFFTLISILLTVVGLFGLVSFTIQRQTKEIGIRKINGALPINIFSHIYSDYVKLVFIAALFSWPMAYYILKNFPGTYKIPQSIWVYLFSVGIVLIVSFITMFYYTLKASMRNPVEALRYE